MNSKKLFRSRQDRKLCGVCGGLGEFFGLDSTIIRLLVVLAFFSSLGSGILVYFIAAFIIPEEE